MENDKVTNKDSDQSSNFFTWTARDITLAAFVWCQPGVEFLNVEGCHPNGGLSLQFKFKIEMGEVEFNQLLLAYTNNKALVEPQKFVQKQGNIRDLLHSVKRQRKIV